MKLLLAAFGIVLLVGTTPQAEVFSDSDDDGYVAPTDDGTEAVNPCAPETYNPDECITPE